MSHRAPGKPPRRLPFRVQVPERNDLIAYALATLAVGLMVGLAIGPMVSGAASVTTLILPGQTEPEVEGTVTETVAMVPSLSSPAGSDIATPSESAPTLVSDPAPAPDPEPAAPPAEEPPGDDYSEPVPPPEEKPDPKPDPDPEPEPEGVLLEGTVLANSPSTKTYWLNAGGDLTTVFAATVPDPGLVVSTRVTPLSNGTLAESDGRSAVDISRQSVLKAVVSHLDPEIGVIVLSGRGASLPVYSAEAENLDGIEVGNRVEAGLVLNVPDPENFSAAGIDPAEELPIRLEEVRKLADQPEIELAGELVSTDPEARLITLATDSTGLLGSTVDLAIPEDFPIDAFTVGKLYSATAVRTEEAVLQLVGFSPVSGKAAANDPSRAFGTHAG